MRTSPARIGTIVFFGVTIALSTYFTFSAVHGDFGLMHRVEIEAETQRLRDELQELEADLSHMENLTRRLSDNYLDLELLDEQARSVLGLIRADEVVIR